MQGYLRAASQISRLAIGDRNASATSATFKIEHSRNQMVRAAGAPDRHPRRHLRSSTSSPRTAST